MKFTMNKTNINSDWVKMRSLFFVPAHVEKFYEKAITSNADVIVLDLEDGVPSDKKEEARANVVKFLDKDRHGKKILVRTNPLGGSDFELDFVICMRYLADGIILPKVRKAADLIEVDSAIESYNDCNVNNHYPSLFPLIENAQAVLNLREIANATNLVQGLVFGHEDYLSDVGGLHTKTNLNLLFARTQIVLSARERGIVPIDTPFLALKDNLGCSEHVRSGKELGFRGMLVLHPNQVDIVNEGYSPSLEDIEYAQEVLNIHGEAKRNNRSIAFVDGKFVAPPIIKQAESLLKRAKELGLI